MKKPASENSEAPDEPAPEEVLYSAELRSREGKYTLTVNDHLHGSREVYAVPKKAVKKIPFYLSMLRSKLS